MTMGKRHPRLTSRRNRNPRRSGKLRDLYRTARLEILESRFALSAPSLTDIPDANVFQGAPYPIALQGTDADGDTLSYSITSSNPSALEVLTTNSGNRTLKITMDGFGENDTDGVMTFQLFEDMAPATTSRIIQLAQQGFYNGLTFHRVIEDFMIQGGDPAGTGSGGSGYVFDDEFSTSLQFTRDGILAMANSGNDTNDSQFFITDGATRWLDYEHTIFGFLTSGDDVRKRVQAVTATNGVPNSAPVIKSVEVVNDTQSDVVLLKLTSVPSSPVDVTVTVNDGHGNTDHQTFTVTPYADSGTYGNSHPFLNTPISTIEMEANSTTTVQLTASDAEGDAARFLAEIKPSTPSITASADVNTGLVTINATNAVAGAYGIYFQTYNDTASDVESEPLWINPAAPSSVTLLNPSSSGATVTNRDNTSAKKLQFKVDGVLSGTTVVVYADGVAVGSATASGSSVTVTTDGTHQLSNGAHSITAVQILEDQTPPAEAGNYHGGARDLTSKASTALGITVNLNDPSDTTPPTFTTAPVAGAGFGAAYEYDADTDEDARGVTFRVVSGPDGLAIDAKTGVVTWTAPTKDVLTDETDYDVTIAAADLSGNETEQAYKIHVGSAPVIDSYETTQTVAEGSELTFTISASDDNAMPLTFSLVKPPAGATVTGGDTTSTTSNSTQFKWTPSESQGPGTYTIKVRATDTTGVPADATITVTVTEVNQTPTLAAVADQVVNEGSLLQVQLAGADADLPANTLTYSFVGDAPEGMELNSSNGLITWTPGETLGGSTFVISVQVSDGSETSSVQSFEVEVGEGDNPPLFNTVGQFKVVRGQQLQVSVAATDPDTPANTLRYEFTSDSTVPAGVQLDSRTGALTWSVPADYTVGTVNFSVRAVEVKAGGTDGLDQTLPVKIDVVAQGSDNGGSNDGSNDGSNGNSNNGSNNGGGTNFNNISFFALTVATTPVADMLSAGRTATIDWLASTSQLGDTSQQFVSDPTHVLGDNGLFGMQLAPDTGRGSQEPSEEEEEQEGEPTLEQGRSKLGPQRQQPSEEQTPKQNQQRKLTRRTSSEAYDAAVEALVAEAQQAVAGRG
jgi:cyclophilin family peptidyl-prolyl cis-trans isomerase